jgi:hypothetical protein
VFKPEHPDEHIGASHNRRSGKGGCDWNCIAPFVDSFWDLETSEGRTLMVKARYTAVLLTTVLAVSTQAATLKSETKDAWDAYSHQATDAMQARLRPGAHFLWLDEQPGRVDYVRAKGPIIEPVNKQIPIKVPHGLIHDWLGAGFLPHVHIEDILSIVRDYNAYKQIYRPGVIDSLVRSSNGEKDLFFMRLANRSVISKAALDSECEAHYIRIDDHRLYAYSNTVHVHELARFGTPEQHVLPEDTGTGLIWRLSSITRLEERDGGVYVELEALALSRDIPAALRPFVTPIIRRVSRDSLATSLHQTKIAIDEQSHRREAVRAAP